jgi:hypothetical protein
MSVNFIGQEFKSFNYVEKTRYQLVFHAIGEADLGVECGPQETTSSFLIFQGEELKCSESGAIITSLNLSIRAKKLLLASKLFCPLNLIGQVC